MLRRIGKLTLSKEMAAIIITRWAKRVLTRKRIQYSLDNTKAGSGGTQANKLKLEVFED